jgi:hypothetical protein
VNAMPRSALESSLRVDELERRRDQATIGAEGRES